MENPKMLIYIFLFVSVIARPADEGKWAAPVREYAQSTGRQGSWVDHVPEAVAATDRPFGKSNRFFFLSFFEISLWRYFFFLKWIAQKKL